MTIRARKLAGLLTAGVVLSSGAYALGSQSGDGGAVAAATKSSSSTTNGSGAARQRGAGHGRGFGGRGDFGLDGLATALGVTPTALRDALDALRASKTPEQRRADFIQALATALSKPVDEVTTAVNSALPDRGARKDELTAALAQELGVDTAKVQAGIDKLRSDLRTGPRDHGGQPGDRLDAVVNAIAASTGVDAAKVRAALEKLRADRGDRHDARGGRDQARQRLAAALKVTPAELQTALDKVETDERNAFATALAQKLNIDVQKVQSALQDLPGRGPRHG